MKVFYILVFLGLNFFVFHLNSKQDMFSFQKVLVGLLLLAAIFVAHVQLYPSLGLFAPILFSNLVMFSASPILIKFFMRFNIFVLKSFQGYINSSSNQVDKLSGIIGFLSSWGIYLFIYLFQLVVILNDGFRDHYVEILSSK